MMTIGSVLHGLVIFHEYMGKERSFDRSNTDRRLSHKLVGWGITFTGEEQNIIKKH